MNAGLKVKSLHGKPATECEDENLPRQCKLARLESDIRKLQNFKRGASEKPVIMFNTRKDLLNPAEKDIRRRLAKMRKGADTQKKSMTKKRTTKPAKPVSVSPKKDEVASDV
jgi:hypothetical protein